MTFVTQTNKSTFFGRASCSIIGKPYLVIGWEEGTGAGLEVLFLELFWEFGLALVFDASAE